MESNGQNKSAVQCINDLITQAPVAISFLKGPDLVIESANPHILELWGNPCNIMGMPLALALPGADKLQFVNLVYVMFTKTGVFGTVTKPKYYLTAMNAITYFILILFINRLRMIAII
ncbi:hypothetical protein [Mucilaginibacter aquaedulcis]|uniref:hypothetical protein n=1 Tax=Mucilaginibacter aquaedulcis TaxID=1187081 RepID=UPI0025B3B3C5|nr:hypothetical protein [Mucilaginibacter aquaedulcis]MDN3549464.1 hypothetical protein [Mucilaginibacter aquaedulcis]